VAVVTSPSQVLSFLRCGVVSVLDWNSVGNGISSHEGKLMAMLWVHV